MTKNIPAYYSVNTLTLRECVSTAKDMSLFQKNKKKQKKKEKKKKNFTKFQILLSYVGFRMKNA